MIPPDKTAALVLEKQLATTNYDCVVIGAGIRLPPKNLSLLETVINTVRNAAPNAPIALSIKYISCRSRSSLVANRLIVARLDLAGWTRRNQYAV